MPPTPLRSDGHAFGSAFKGKRVFLTGHTGFKGSWLAEWLLLLGAEVAGYSLPPPTTPALFEQLGLQERLHHVPGDIRDAGRLAAAISGARPDFIFHLAAQSLVRDSYQRPLETYAVNVLGTAHVLEAARALRHPCVVLCITSDKCYENREWLYAYREEDALGGHDPYSSSKAAAEILIASWRRSFFGGHPVKVASARSGNVIGGGDWARDRILPDCIRALRQGAPIVVRNPGACRPWQHVLEPLSGYLWLAARIASLKEPGPSADALCGAFNFGPRPEAERTVAELVGEVLGHWPGRWEDQSDPKAPHEARQLRLATDKARTMLGWSAAWTFAEAVRQTVRWYRAVESGSDAGAVRTLTVSQIREYCHAAKEAQQSWALIADAEPGSTGSRRKSGRTPAPRGRRAR